MLLEIQRQNNLKRPMAKTPSKMIELGTQAPNFILPNVVSGKELSLDADRNKQPFLVMFICNHCPYVKHIQKALVNFANDFSEKGLKIYAINSNDVKNYPEDSPELMKTEAQHYKYPFPYLFDESQNVAKAYEAACTPDFFLYDKDAKLVYRGQFDDSRPGNNTPPTGTDLRKAAELLLSEKQIPIAQKPSLGCNIKWKP